MATLLFSFILVIYIGLGIPDSSFGAALPVMWKDLNLPLSLTSAVTILIYACTTLASFFSARIINKVGPGIVTFVSTLLTALALLGFSLSNSIFFICACAIPAGLGAGAIDSALNNYVAVHYKPIHVNFLHCFYGVGVALSPLVFSFTLKGNGDWRLGYLILFIAQISLSVLSFLILPLWKKVEKNTPKEQAFSPITVKYKDMAKVRAVRMGWLAFFSTCALEFTCDTWGTSFLVGEGLTPSLAATFLMIYYIGMALGRFISGLISSKLKIKTVFIIGYSLILVAIIVMALPIPTFIKGCALFFIGLGNGPTFPNLTCLTPQNFGKEASQSLISSQAVSANLGILIVPPVFSVIAQTFSTSLLPYLLAVLYIAMAISTILYFKLPKQKLI